VITFDCFLSELNRLATGYHANHYCGSYEKLSADEKAEIKERYETLNQFECIDKFQLKAQRDDYDTTYMGEGVKAGDMLWFDGEYFCNRDTVDQENLGATNEKVNCTECIKIWKHFRKVKPSQVVEKND
jgi:hypothetical protein